WRAWWVGDALGDLVVAPFLLLWGSSLTHLKWKWSRVIEVVALSVSLVLVSKSLFMAASDVGGLPLPNFPDVIFPFVLQAAIRFDQSGRVTAIFIVSAYAILGASINHGPFAHGVLREKLFLMYGFISVLSARGMFVASALTERRRAIVEREAAQGALYKSLLN